MPTHDRVLRRKRRAENFPVALRLLPRQLRADLVAVYDVARTIDDLGDAAVGDRTALLTEFGADLAAVWAAGRPAHPVLQRLVPAVQARGLDREPFERLVQANLIDQRVSRYATYAQLREYCVLSAEPVGRIVLDVFGVRSPAAIELSDRICAALQLIEHWQDVAEDRRADRVYLPQEDLAAFGVAEVELDGTVASPTLRRLMAFQTTRSADLLDSGAPLIGLLNGWARLAVAGYLAGGRAALDALRRVDGDVLGGAPLPRRRDVLRHLLGLLREGNDAGAPELDSRAVRRRSNNSAVELGRGRAVGRSGGGRVT
ncbi:MAG: squalene synthase HpnC [Actinomycetota bacterium]|nr:squalene synthase HpnC [Actinomycetota bacterium]